MNRMANWLVGSLAAAVVAATALSAAVITAAGPARSGQDGASNLPDVCVERPKQRVELATAKLIIEYNATDDDLGVHGAFDDQGWSELCVFDPSGRPIAVFDPRSQLNDLTMAGVFFESREPPISEFSMDQLAAAFPEGEYTVRAKSFDGRVLIGTALFTHDVPIEPTIVAPDLAEDPEHPGTPVPVEGLVVDWEPVTETLTGDPVEITGYEVIVTKEDHDDPHGFSRPIYDVHVPATLTSLSVPPEFLEPETVYELEVLALETSGNQTISVGFFVTD
jgi:hypothetical protein